MKRQPIAFRPFGITTKATMADSTGEFSLTTKVTKSTKFRSQNYSDLRVRGIRKAAPLISLNGASGHHLSIEFRP